MIIVAEGTYEGADMEKVKRLIRLVERERHNLENDLKAVSTESATVLIEAELEALDDLFKDLKFFTRTQDEKS